MNWLVGRLLLLLLSWCRLRKRVVVQSYYTFDHDHWQIFDQFLIRNRGLLAVAACGDRMEPKLKVKSIKPKLEPCDDDGDDEPSPAAASSEDWESTTPLGAGNPFFSTVISKSHVDNKWQLVIPVRLYHLLPEARTAAVLRCGGRTWRMSYCGELKQRRLDSAWAEFAVDNRLQVGDACVFELIMDMDAAGTGGGGGKQQQQQEEVCFQVQILRGGLPREVTSKGATADEPILIVD